MPVLEDGVPPAHWELSDAGRRAAACLAKELALFPVATVLTSAEPKARETARVLAEHLEVPWREWPDLHEQDRENVDHIDAPEVFRAHMRELFDHPDQVVYGRESARAAQARFTRAVEAAIAAHPEGDLAIVCHGTVIALFVAQRSPVDPFELWTQLGLPSIVVLSMPDLALLEVVSCVRPHDG